MAKLGSMTLTARAGHRVLVLVSNYLRAAVPRPCCHTASSFLLFTLIMNTPPPTQPLFQEAETEVETAPDFSDPTISTLSTKGHIIHRSSRFFGTGDEDMYLLVSGFYSVFCLMLNISVGE